MKTAFIAPLLASTGLLIFASAAPREAKPSVSIKDYKRVGGRPVDADAAMNSPGVYAWKLFLSINRPGRDVNSGHRGFPLPGKDIGDPGSTIWESWKHDNEIFLDRGAKPGGFDSPPPHTFDRRQPAKGILLAAAGRGINPFTINWSTLSPQGQQHRPEIATLLRDLHVDPAKLFSEAKMNRRAFDFVRNRRLYSVNGQVAFWRKYGSMSFPREAMEVKAEWKLLDGQPDQIRRRFHTTTFANSVYGLASLHIITKDVPDWFWCTFEQVDNMKPNLPDHENADIQPIVNREFRIPKGFHYPVPKILIGTKWQFYRLRGTQTTFNVSTGEPSLLDNTLLEEGSTFPSSCMSCHARSRVGANGPLPGFPFGMTANPSPPPPFSGPTGPTDPALFRGGNGKKGPIQADFVWALMHAKG